MRLARAPRWAISFADLALLLLGCFVMLHVMQGRAISRSAPVAAPLLGEELLADDLFEPGEARLTERGRTRLAELAAVSGGRGVQIISEGQGPGGSRLDAFELASARAAAAARVFIEAGIAERDIAVTMLPPAAGSPRQRLTFRFER